MRFELTSLFSVIAAGVRWPSSPRQMRSDAPRRGPIMMRFVLDKRRALALLQVPGLAPAALQAQLAHRHHQVALRRHRVRHQVRRLVLVETERPPRRQRLDPRRRGPRAQSASRGRR